MRYMQRKYTKTPTAPHKMSPSRLLSFPAAAYVRLDKAAIGIEAHAVLSTTVRMCPAPIWPSLKYIIKSVLAKDTV